MKTVLRSLTAPSLVGALALVAALPLAASAQSQLDTAQATDFLGSWAINFDSPQGAFVLDVELTDNAGKVAASVGSELTGGMQDVADVSRSGDNLVLRYEFDAQGQLVPVALTLTLVGAEVDATMDFADGAFTMSGHGTK